MANIGQIFGSLLGTAAGTAEAPAATIVDAAGKLIGMFKLDPTVKAQLEQQLTLANLDMEKTELAATVASVQGQLEINKAEAQSPNWFTAGWRPAVGWVCVTALAWSYVGQPFVTFLLAAFRVNFNPALLPKLDTQTLIFGLLVPLLGIAGMRTIEKVSGTEDNR